ncbi:MAG: hypothetical protein K2L15_02760 [Eubacteriales bacterium]|nr:hypothetical protein [Eubacteriales bacterium]
MKKFKKMVVPFAMASMMVLGGTGVFANTIEDYGKGSEIIDGRARGIVGDGITSSEIGAGYWIRGKRGSQLVSEYKHYTGEGRASVTNGEGNYVDGGWKEANVFSKASTTWTFKGTNRANYDYR